jgi:hypothetical protein
MAAIKPLDKVSKIWAKRASGARDEYKDGVENPRKDWKDETAAASERYKAGLEESFSNDSFKKGVEAAGSDKWQRKARKLGPGRYSEGVRAAESDYKTGFAPFHARIANTVLPPRGPKGSPENIDRVRAISEALHDEKLNK